ncbi:MAG: helix-turn-helix domain-containing protein [Isosphaeraceae bacterium]
MTEQEFESLLTRGYETDGVEFKGSWFRTDRLFLARVVRAILGMANRRDGGRVILGVEESTNLEPVGLSDGQAESWLHYDDLSATVNEYASPCVRFEPRLHTLWGKKFVIIRVHQFDDIPILCAKDYNEPGKAAPVLRRGACYVRARHKPETSEIPSEEEMRELLELAIDIGVRKFVTRAQQAGLFPTIPSVSDRPTDEASFERQIEEME